MVIIILTNLIYAIKINLSFHCLFYAIIIQLSDELAKDDLIAGLSTLNMNEGIMIIITITI